MLALSKQKSPVKIEKFSVSKKYGREDIVINKRTIITPTVVSFDHVDLEETMEIKALKNVRPDQLVSVRGTIVELSGTKTVLLQGNNVKKQEAFLADPTGYVKVILWGSHTDNVEKDLTYNFNKLRVKMYQNQMYLNTPKQENQCVITQSEPFKEKLPNVEELSTLKEAVGNIIGLYAVNRYKTCRSCSKKVTENGNVSFCETCKLTQKSSRCPTQLILKLLVETSSPPVEKIRLTVYHDVVVKLFQLCNITVEATENQISAAILELDDIKICYDTQSHKLVDLENVDI